MMSPGRSDFQGPTRERLIPDVGKVGELRRNMNRWKDIIGYSPLLGDFDRVPEGCDTSKLRLIRCRDTCV